jgi:hypothetical protein
MRLLTRSSMTSVPAHGTPVPTPTAPVTPVPTPSLQGETHAPRQIGPLR